ncbi:energy transducer TonB [Mitsuaria sp. TWR114]|nr:energy transducer TonB [Mitsuaria sp. TWR114]
MPLAPRSLSTRTPCPRAKPRRRQRPRPWRRCPPWCSHPHRLPPTSPPRCPPINRLCSERQTARHYPALLRDRGIQGLVRLRVKVDPEWRAAEVVIAGGSGWRLLDEAARRVAESCPYTPARRGDQRLASWIEYPVRFALQAAPLQ